MPQRTRSKCAAGSRSVGGAVGGVDDERRVAARTALDEARGSARAGRGSSRRRARRRSRSGSSGPTSSVARGEPRSARVRGPSCRAGPSRCRASRARRPRRAALGELVGPGHDVGVRPRRATRSSSGVSAPITRIGASIPAARSSAASSAVATASQRRAAGERGARGRHGAVPVAVRLDDRAQRRPCGSASCRSCARSRRGRSRASARSASRSRREGAEHVEARDDADERPSSRPPAGGCGPTRGSGARPRCTVVSGLDRVGVARSSCPRRSRRTPCAGAPRTAQRLEEDRAAEQVDVVRQVEVALVVGQHESASVTIPTQRPSPSTTGTPGQLVLAQHARRPPRPGVRADRRRVGVHDVAHQLGHSRRATPTGASGRAGSASITSPAIDVVGADALRRGPAGERVGERAERGGLERRRAPWPAARRSGPTSTSPVPAVASAGVPPRADRHGPAGRGDDRVVALQQDDRAAALGRLARAGEPVRARPRRTRRSSSRPSSPSCGVSTVGACALAQRLEPPGVGVQAVGVDQQRHLDRRARPPRANSAAPSARPRPGPSTTAPARSAISSTHLDARRACATPSSLGQPAAHLLEQAQVDRRLRGLRHRHLHVAGAGALGRARGHRRRAGQARASRRRPPPRPDLELRPAARAARVEVEHALGDQARRRGAPARPRGIADLDDLDAAGVLLARARRAGPTLEPWKVAVARGAHGLALDLAGRGVDARRARRRRRPGASCALIAAIAAGDRLARRALEAGAEQGVDDRARAVEPLGCERLGRRRPAAARGWRRASPAQLVRAAPPRARPPRGPSSRSSRAATRPSPPLLPLPTTTRTGPGRPRPRPPRARGPAPARSIRSSEGTPCSSIAQASTARISAASKSGIEPVGQRRGARQFRTASGDRAGHRVRVRQRDRRRHAELVRAARDAAAQAHLRRPPRSPPPRRRGSSSRSGPAPCHRLLRAEARRQVHRRAGPAPAA